MVLPGGVGQATVTIDYTYDPLYRLTAADYDTGDYYHYSYDAVGNRLTQDSSVSGLTSNVSYGYDIANRLVNVDGMAYTWDDNGNLLADGENIYAYDAANRLVSVSGPSSVGYAYRCNGKSISQFGCESDRVSQTVDGVTTNYVLDQAAPLTQVLSDGTNSYLYGNDRITQSNGTTPEYFLIDGLGSVRQLVNNAGEVTLTQNYAPYGEILNSSGSGSSHYAFTGEMADSTGLVYLRARYYAPANGRFINRDTWGGDYNSPVTLNRWQYGYSNPIRYTDPSGHDPSFCAEAPNPALCLEQWIKRNNREECGPPQTKFDKVIFVCGVNDGTACATGNGTPLFPFRAWAERNGYSNGDFAIVDVDDYYFPGDPTKNAKLDAAEQVRTKIVSGIGERVLLIGHSAGADSVIFAASKTNKGRIAGIVLLDPFMYIPNYGDLHTLANNLSDPKFIGLSSEGQYFSGKRIIVNITGQETTSKEYPLSHTQLALSDLVVSGMVDAFKWMEMTK